MKVLVTGGLERKSFTTAPRLVLDLFWDVSGRVRGSFTDASPEKTEQQLPNESAVVCEIIRTCVLCLKQLSVLRDTGNELDSHCC